ncbi:class I SAM-dependent methyltransferase [Amycolatopsis thermophila]|uniref:SAM-dependent methyltransferase n=1 Tax=Amycolatopsis thermophila TaxID=206084 RepID=A0ABU0F3F8_9PSEU|nr:class I SAM-dependent methyltransferase [Amycolatopsis thermophila]MDQ0382110.1 SAM-dependent methyltransferase [Amycolatopsis thermophila]
MNAHPTGYDAELRRHTEVLRRACDIQLHDHVLDLGCGAGQTTRQAARAARAGGALGVDISAPAIERARELARAEGLGNVTFEHADAQVHPFPPQRFDLAISRFGTMFFADPTAAFSNIARALHPGGRLVMLVWQTADRNDWDIALRRALDAEVPPGGPDPFSLGEPSTVRQVLGSAGLADVTFTDIREPVCYGPDVPTALDWVRGFTCTSRTLRRLDPATAARAVERLRETLAARLTGAGVEFGSRAWLVTARRP